MDMTHKTIENLFYKQIRNLTLQEKMKSFDTQFGDTWI
jgi:hypothetical protein